MKTTTTLARKTDTSTLLDAAKRILLGGEVDPTLAPELLREYVERHDEAARRGDGDERWKWRNALRDKRHAGVTWDVVDEDGALEDEIPDGVTVALLQDIRDELRGIRAALERRR
jgi:hypothetical protein